MNIKLDTSLPYHRKINLLTEFNHALVYGFEPEASPHVVLGSTRWEDTLYPSAGQFEDMLDAYLFAQNTMIPVFRDMFSLETVKEDLLEQFIKQLHGFIANTLMTVNYDKSGEYTQQQVIRWNPSRDSDIYTHFILSGMAFNGKDPLKLLINLFDSELGLKKKETLQFVAILNRLKRNNSIKIRESQIKFLEGSNDIATITKEKLCVAYLDNKLSLNERSLVKRIVTICMDPANIPQAMNAFAKTTFASWKACDKQDIQAVSECLAEMFYQLTEIHPFGNANGRTATALMNVFLRSINLPSILLRNPGERGDASSSYSRAFACINETRSLLAQHIYQRILDTQRRPHNDSVLAETIGLRCELARVLKQLTIKHPDVDVNNYQNVLNHAMVKASQSLPKGSGSTLIVIEALKILVGFVNKEIIRLDEVLLKTQKPATTFIGTTTTLSLEVREQIKANLCSLTKLSGWKINPKNHLEAWIEIPIQEDADKTALLLKSEKIGDTVLSKRSDNFTPIVKCSNIKLNVLQSAADKLPEISNLTISQ